jgi:hypothetical protein
MTPEQRRLRAQLAANARWSRPMSREDQADAARAAMHDRLARQVDPLGELPPDERDRRVRSAARPPGYQRLPVDVEAVIAAVRSLRPPLSTWSDITIAQRLETVVASCRQPIQDDATVINALRIVARLFPPGPPRK